jgi:Fungal specific transcription factor domain
MAYNDEDDDSEDDFPSPDTSNSSSNHQGFIFGLSSQNVDMYSLHPPKEHVPIYWQLYRENVDPLVKIIHVPTMTPEILEAAQHLDSISKGMEALLMVIYYSAATSLWDDECREKFGENKDDLLARYRFGVEQALARADFLETDEVVVLQAFVIFLICLRRNDDARIIWTLTGLVVRMAQTLGIHRDGSHYNLTPFQIEMRRRLWWQICILDARASEDHGSDPTIIEQVFDTQMPLNVNDSDLHPDMAELPEAKVGCTEMTFGLIRFEISSTLRKLQYVPPGPKKCQQFFSNVSLEKKEQWIRECHQRFEERYLQHCDMSVPLYWVSPRPFLSHLYTC